MKKIFLFIALFLFFIPNISLALSSDYEDLVYKVTGEELKEDKVNIYLFYGNGCPHCEKEEKFLAQLEEKYKDKIQIFKYETWYNSENTNLMLKIKESFNLPINKSVPFTIVGKETYVGYNDYVGTKIEGQLKSYLEINNDDENIVDKDKEQIPLLGEINVKEVSVGLVAIILGFVDGFNPCAMWVLLFLINMLFGMKNKKKMFLLGFVFLLTSAFVYFLSMLGITAVLSYISVPFIRSIIGIIAVIIGIYNVTKYYKTRNDDAGCHVVDDKKRKKIFTRIKKFTTEKNLFLALVGVIALAVSVNIVELACSTVFPATFAEILAVNNITGLSRIIYLLIYTLFYMIDDMVIFVIAVSTLNITTASSKYGKYSSLVGGIIMFIVGLLLVFKPEWVMFNF